MMRMTIEDEGKVQERREGGWGGCFAFHVAP